MRLRQALGLSGSAPAGSRPAAAAMAGVPADTFDLQLLAETIGRNGTAVRRRDLLALAAQSRLGEDLVVQTPYGDSGKTTFFVRGERDWNADAEEMARQELKVMRRMLASYVRLPNYQNYWIEAGYADEMRAVRTALASGDDAGVQAAMSDRWLADVTLFGTAAEVRDGVEAWRAAGVRTVILVPSSTRGGQMVAFEELLAAFSS